LGVTAWRWIVHRWTHQLGVPQSDAWATSLLAFTEIYFDLDAGEFFWVVVPGPNAALCWHMVVVREEEPVLLTLDTDQSCPLYWVHLHRKNITRIVHFPCTRENGVGLPAEYRDHLLYRKSTEAQPVVKHALSTGTRLTKEHMHDLCSWLFPAHTDRSLNANELFERLLLFLFDTDGARVDARLAADRPLQTIDSRFDDAAQDPLMEDVVAHFEDDEHNKKDFNPLRVAVRRKSMRKATSVIDAALKMGRDARSKNALAKAEKSKLHKEKVEQAAQRKAARVTRQRQGINRGRFARRTRGGYCCTCALFLRFETVCKSGNVFSK
jgi:hypothetical protein